MELTDRDIQRFWSHVEKTDRCWIWHGSSAPRGYGAFSITREGVTRAWRAHRLAYELVHAASPGDLFVCHTCDNRKCVRPDHLFLGTARDNALDMVKKDRHLRGTRTKNAVLNDSSVIEISRRYLDGGITFNQLAIEYGVSVRTIRHVVFGTKWQHVKREVATRDFVRTANSRSGERHNQVKLSWEVVNQLRMAHKDGATIKELSIRYGIPWTTVRHIIRGETWRQTNGC